MLQPEDLTPEIRRILARKAQQGVRFSDTEIELYIKCKEQAYTINELAAWKNQSYQNIFNAVKKLAQERFVRKSYQAGKQSYWEAMPNLEDEHHDLRQVFYHRNKEINFGELIWYLDNPRDVELAFKATQQLLVHIYVRARLRGKGVKKLPAPTAVEIKTTLISLSKVVEEYYNLLQQIINTDQLFSTNEHLYGALGDYPDKTIHRFMSSEEFFRNYWNNTYSTRGIDTALRFHDPKIVAQANAEDWNDSLKDVPTNKVWEPKRPEDEY